MEKPPALKENPILIGADHAGFALKEKLRNSFPGRFPGFEDMGVYDEEPSSYSATAHAVAKALQSRGTGFGVLICGTGLGMSMAANRHKGIRAALCWSKEVALLARRHNDANVIIFGSRFIQPELACECLSLFLETPFEGGRHTARVRGIDDL